MGNVAEMRVIVGDKDRETERAEELRILEALLFAAEGPLDEKVLAKRLPAGPSMLSSSRPASGANGCSSPTWIRP